MDKQEAQSKAIHAKAKNIEGKKERPTRAGFPNGAKGGIYGGMHLDEAMRHEERRIKRNKDEVSVTQGNKRITGSAARKVADNYPL